MSIPLSDSLRWAEEGTRLFCTELQRLNRDDKTFNRPSALPGWTLKHLVGHVGKNADAIGNLASWATTGVETPMYSSPEQRKSDIEASTRMTPDELITEFESASQRLHLLWEQMTDRVWQHEVRTAQGRLVPASETPWMRAREVMVHAVDLDTGITFQDLPEDFLAALTTDICTKRSTGGNPSLSIEPNDYSKTWQVKGSGDTTVVVGSLSALTGWLSGRTTEGITSNTGTLPSIPAWL